MEVSALKDFRKHDLEFVFSDTDEAKLVYFDPTLFYKGEVAKFIVIVPDWHNSVSLKLKVFNEDGKEMFASSSLAQNEGYNITLIRNECILLGEPEEFMKLELSGAPGGLGGTVAVFIYIER